MFSAIRVSKLSSESLALNFALLKIGTVEKIAPICRQVLKSIWLWLRLMHTGFHDEITKCDTRSSKALDIKQGPAQTDDRVV